MILLKVLEDEAQHTFLERYSGVFSSVLIIILFAVERLINGRENRRQNRLKWYSNVVIQPNLPRIHKFFDDYIEEITRINRVRKNIMTFSEREENLMKAKEYNTLRILSRDFEFDFLILVQQFNIQLYSDLLYGTINDLYDFIVENLDKESLSQDIILNQVKSSKALFFSQLYSIIQN